MSETYNVKDAVNLPLTGDALPRYEARAKVTGTARYAADESLAGTLHAVLVTTAEAAGSVSAIDTEKAQSVPGVRLILTHKNMPNLVEITPFFQGGAGQSGFRPLNGTEIRFSGQIVALAVAETLEAAQRAADLIKVSVDAASSVASMHTDDAPSPTQVPTQAFEPIEKGDIEAVLSSGTAIEAEYRTPNQHHNPIELWFTSAVWRNGGLTAYVPSQWVAGTRAALATAFELPISRVRVVSRFVGGAFGSKATVMNHTLIACAAARMLKAPVKMYVERDQMFTVGSMRAQTTHRLRVGVANGRLSALEHIEIGQTSTFDTFFMPGTEGTARMYDWQAIRASEHVVPTNVNTPGFMRAPPETPALFALESAVDEAAWAVGIDPLALRLASDAAEREPVNGLPWTSRSLRQCLETGAAEFGWSDWRPQTRAMRRGDWLHGYGLASAMYPVITAPATADLRVGSDLSATVLAAGHDMGQGAYTVCQQIVARELGLDPKRVAVELGDSDLPPNVVAGGSVQSASLGSAVLDGCRQIQRKLAERATGAGGTLEGADPATLEFAGGAISSGDRRVKIETVFEGIAFGVLEARGTWQPASVGIKSVRELYRSGTAKQVGLVTDDFARAAFGAQFVEVAVHALTGEVRVPRMVGAFAFGRILNARTARSQLEGGMIWGIGSVLHEVTEIDTRYARYINSDLGEYLVPVNADVVDLTALMIEEVDEHINPLGVKGVGEIGITGVNAAIANAVYHATGVRVRTLPLRMEQLI
nr:xanthine dehydrogenase family protein molybdopterin-binding subunit [uncultured Halomonas sp.]